MQLVYAHAHAVITSMKSVKLSDMFLDFHCILFVIDQPVYMN